MRKRSIQMDEAKVSGMPYWYATVNDITFTVFADYRPSVPALGVSASYDIQQVYDVVTPVIDYISGEYLERIRHELMVTHPDGLGGRVWSEKIL